MCGNGVYLEEFKMGYGIRIIYGMRAYHFGEKLIKSYKKHLQTMQFTCRMRAS